MPNRPKIYSLLAFFYLAHGLIAIVATTIYKDLSSVWAGEIFKLTFTMPYIIYYWAIPLITVCAIYKMRKYSFYTFMISQVTMLLLPFVSKSTVITEISYDSQFIFYFIQASILASVIYFTRKDNYHLFFEASKRQWEWAKRHPLTIDFSIKSHSTNFIIDAETKNISATGILFSVKNLEEHIKSGHKFLANISYADIEISLPFKIVRTSKGSTQTYFGAKFNHKGLWQYVQLRRLIHEVSARRFEQARVNSEISFQENKAA